MSLALLFHYLLLKMFRMLVHPSSEACYLLWIYFMSCIALVRYVLVLRCGLAGNKSTISRKLLKMDVLTFETCWAVNSEIIKQVTSSWSIFIQSYLKVQHKVLQKFGIYWSLHFSLKTSCDKPNREYSSKNE